MWANLLACNPISIFIFLLSLLLRLCLGDGRRTLLFLSLLLLLLCLEFLEGKYFISNGFFLPSNDLWSPLWAELFFCCSLHTFIRCLSSSDRTRFSSSAARLRSISCCFCFTSSACWANSSLARFSSSAVLLKASLASCCSCTATARHSNASAFNAISLARISKSFSSKQNAHRRQTSFVWFGEEQNGLPDCCFCSNWAFSSTFARRIWLISAREISNCCNCCKSCCWKLPVSSSVSREAVSIRLSLVVS